MPAAKSCRSFFAFFAIFCGYLAFFVFPLRLCFLREIFQALGLP
jgi:hypothetical protein